ncbi:hypothetical protein B484DRAFT_437372 [Ochromonadaceae sp. CCMP2298]|nr:hypothetical protein B484DRAFT_437372 [Ochromonadaceae sp. CCMP2298]
MGGEYVMGSGADIDIDVDSAPKRTGLPDMGRLTGVGGPLLPLNGLSAKSPRSPSHSPRSLRPSLSPISLSPLTLRSSPSASSPRSLRPSLAPSPLSRHLSPSSSCADVLSIGGSETAGEEDRDSDSDSDRVRDRDSEGGIAFLSSFLEGDETGLIPRKKSKKKRRGRKHTSLSSVSVASSPTSISSRKKHRDAVADASVKGGKVQAQGHGQAQMQVHGQVQGVAQGQAQRRRVRSASAGAWDDGKLDWHVKGTRAAAGAVLVEEDIFPGAEQRSPHNSGVLHLLGSSTYTDSPIGNNNTSTTTPAKALGLPRVPGAQS